MVKKSKAGTINILKILSMYLRYFQYFSNISLIFYRYISYILPIHLRYLLIFFHKFQSTRALNILLIFRQNIDVLPIFGQSIFGWQNCVGPDQYPIFWRYIRFFVRCFEVTKYLERKTYKTKLIIWKITMLNSYKC